MPPSHRFLLARVAAAFVALAVSACTVDSSEDPSAQDQDLKTKPTAKTITVTAVGPSYDTKGFRGSYIVGVDNSPAALRHLELDDLTVAGKAYPGSAKIEFASGTGKNLTWYPLADCSAVLTHTSLDVVPGRYRVTTSAITPMGEMSDTEIVDVP